MTNRCRKPNTGGGRCKNKAQEGFAVCSAHRRALEARQKGSPKAQRDSLIVGAYVSQKKSLKQIAAETNLTAEGVRVVLTRRGVKMRTRREAALVRQQQRRSMIDENAVVREYLALRSVKGVSAKLGISLMTVGDIVRERLPLVERRAHPAQMYNIPEERAKAFLVAAFTAIGNGHPLSRSTYDAWAIDHDAPQARTLVVQTGFPGWGALCEYAGVPAFTFNEKPGPKRQWSDKQLLSHVKWVAYKLGRAPTYGEYDAQSRGDPLLASGSLVRRRISRSWATVLRRAIPDMAEEVADPDPVLVS